MFENVPPHSESLHSHFPAVWFGHVLTLFLLQKRALLLHRQATLTH